MASSDVVASVTSGLRINHGSTGITPAMLPRITFSPTIGISTRRIDKLGADIRSFREPLKEAIQKVIIPSIRLNFDSGGRPAWVPLSAATLEIRKRFGIGGSKILVRTGALRRTLGTFQIWSVDTNQAILENLPASVSYGVIHQAGYGTRSTRQRMGTAGRSTKKGLIQVFKSGSDNDGPYIPARPFVLLQPKDVTAIEAVFAEWLQKRVEANWGGL